jgi:uncharacterized membrane protein
MERQAMDSEDAGLAERLARLETEVERLARRLDAQEHAARPTRPAPPVPLPAAKAHGAPARKPLNPAVLVAAAGAVIFLAGAAFFLHLAIQLGWIGPGRRVILGLAIGTGLAGYGGRFFFRSGPALGTCLLGAGLGTLLFTLYVGAFHYQLFPPPLGFAAAAVTTLAAGALAARARSGAALCAALLVGLAAPVIFAQGGRHEVALAVYLAVLMGAATAVPYAAGTGARWAVARWLALLGVWYLLALAAGALARPDVGAFMGLLVLHYFLAAFWIWLPGQGEPKPSSPTLLWQAATVAMTALLWICWRQLGLSQESFAVPLATVALGNLFLIWPLRLRLGGRQADPGLLVLAGVLLALVPPVALAWRWVGPAWGLYAAALAWSAERLERRPGWEREEVLALTGLAAGAAALATLRWAFHLAAAWDGPVPTPLVNPWFAEGALTAAAWGFLARRQGSLGRAAFAGLELTGNVVLALELGRAMRFAGFGARVEDAVRTLILAASGAVQWILGFRVPTAGTARALAAAGYACLAAASLKLVLHDLAQASTPLRALVFLGVGGIFLAAAVVGNHLRAASGK